MNILKAATIKEVSKLRYPLIASPKVDGIRAVVIDGVLYSRNMKPIRNQYTQRLFGRPEYNGYDGELAVGDIDAPDVYRQTASGVMSADGKPDVRFHVFDRFDLPGGYGGRFQNLRVGKNLEILETQLIETEKQLLLYEEKQLYRGMEGIMLRAPDGLYKHGRSTLREQYLMKLKRFVDEEFEVVGYEERMHNRNEAKRNVLGKIERSSHKENMVPAGDLGALILRFDDTRTFNVGSGFTAEERVKLWKIRDSLIGTYVTVKYFSVGDYDVPRFPVFLKN